MSNPALDNRTPRQMANAARIRQRQLLEHLMAMRDVRTPVRVIPENRQPTAPIKGGDRIAVFQSGFGVEMRKLEF